MTRDEAKPLRSVSSRPMQNVTTDCYGEQEGSVQLQGSHSGRAWMINMYSRKGVSKSMLRIDLSAESP